MAENEVCRVALSGVFRSHAAWIGTVETGKTSRMNNPLSKWIDQGGADKHDRTGNDVFQQQEGRAWIICAINKKICEWCRMRQFLVMMLGGLANQWLLGWLVTSFVDRSSLLQLLRGPNMQTETFECSAGPDGRTTKDFETVEGSAGLYGRTTRFFSRESGQSLL